VVAPDGQGRACAGLPAQASEHRVAGHPGDLDARGGLERLGVRALGSLAHDAHVERHRLGIRVDPVVGVLVEGDEPRLVGLDELAESSR